MRFWLCSSSSKSNDMKREEFVEGHEVEFEGSNTIPICELKFSSDSLHFVPCRIRHFKCKVAILFKADYFLSDPSRFIIYDLNSRGTICTKFSVRDVSFIDENNILILSESGETIVPYNILTKTEGNPIHLSNNSMKGSQIFYLNKKIYMIAFDGTRQCLIHGYIGSSDKVLWLEPGEEALNVIALPNYSTSSYNIAMSTNRRIVIASEDLMKLNEHFGNFQCPSLFPLGSHCIAFFDCTGELI